MSSPELKHRRLEERSAFVPPQFQLPARPPVSGFPTATDLLVPAARRGSAVDGKALLLNAAPTLELPAEEAESFLAALRQHPKSASIRSQLNDINETYLEEVFGEADAQEEDTRRRVDYNAACAVLKANTSKRLSACVSCLTRGQHRHYRSWMLNYMQTGIPPKATDEYPDMSTVLDLVQREQAAYMQKFMEETVSCEACKIEAGCKKRSGEAAEMPASHRSCWNHNYIDEHVEQFAKRWWRYRVESRLLRCFADDEASKGNKNQQISSSSGDGDDDKESFKEKILCLKKGPARDDAETGVTVKPVATLTSQTRELAAKCIAATNTSKTAGVKTQGRLSAVSIPPTLPLAVQQLDTREPQLYPSASSPTQQRSEEATNNEHMLSLSPPVNSMAGVSFTLCVCKSALVELATAHLSSCRAEFRLPVRCVWSPSKRRVDISIEKPLPGDCESRRNINAAALKRLVDNEPCLPSNSHCSARGGVKSKCCAEVSFGNDFVFHCLSNCAYDLTHHHPVFRMIKMEYNCKGYNTVPDDEQTFHYERFNKREVVRMWIILHCNPTAVLYVYRINAYSNAVMGIEEFTSASFMTQVLGPLSSKMDVHRTWDSLSEVLHSTVSNVITRLGSLEGADSARDVVFILSKAKKDGDVFLSSVNACYPEQTVDLDEAVKSFIEPRSPIVCRREYLPPCVWPFPDRIPYTYGPAPKSCHVVNRTTETRHDSAYYAKHDVWEHESRYYTVDEDGVIQLMQPASS